MSARPESLLQSQVFLVGAQGIRVTLGVAITAVFIRKLGDDGFGAVTLVTTSLALAAGIVEAGVGAMLVAELSRPVGGARFYHAVFRLRRMLALGASAVVVIWLFTSDRPSDTTLVPGLLACLMIATVLSYPCRIASSLFAAHRLNRVPAAISFMVPVVFALIALPLVSILGRDALPWVLLMIAAREAAAALMPSILARRAGLKPGEPDANSDVSSRGLFAIIAATICASLYFHVDVLMIGIYHDAAAVGAYGSSLRLFVPVAVLVSLLTAPMVPLFSRARQQAMIPAALTVVAGVILPVILLFLLLPHDLAGILTGYSDHPSADVTPWLGLAGLPLAVSGVASLRLVTARLTAWWCGAAAAGLAINVGLNVWLIPKSGPVGAAQATVVTEAFVGIVAWAMCLRHIAAERHVAISKLAPHIIRALVPATVAAAIVLFADLSTPFRLPFAVTLAVAAVMVFTFSRPAARLRAMIEEDA